MVLKTNATCLKFWILKYLYSKKIIIKKNVFIFNFEEKIKNNSNSKSLPNLNNLIYKIWKKKNWFLL
jgi:hypothetical protein